MASRQVKVGDGVSHDGNWFGDPSQNTDFEIVALKAGGEDPDDSLRRLPDFLATFENDGYKVTCLTSDLRWLEEDQAWHMVGRLLSRVQRAAFCLLTGSSSCNPNGHIGARSIFRSDPERAAGAVVVVAVMLGRDVVAAELGAAEGALASEDQLSGIRARLVDAELAAAAALDEFHG